LLQVRSAVVLYHHPCIDGIYAALAAHVHFKQQRVKCRFVPHRVYEDIDPSQLPLTPEDDVFLCDYVGPTPSFALTLCQRARSVTILDHHKTALEGFAVLPAEWRPVNLDINLDMSRSGATMALDYFQPQGLSSDQRQLFLYAEDADLWRWKLPQSREFNAGMTELPRDTYNFDASTDTGIFDQLLALTPGQLIEQGAAVLEQQNRIISAVLEQSYTIQLGGSSRDWGRCLAVRADAASDLRSHIGSRLAAKSEQAGLRAIGAVAYIEEAMGDSSRVKVSLRGTGEEDTTEVSAALGGGGHCNASSFITALSEFNSWRV